MVLDPVGNHFIQLIHANPMAWDPGSLHRLLPRPAVGPSLEVGRAERWCHFGGPPLDLMGFNEIEWDFHGVLWDLVWISWDFMGTSWDLIGFNRDFMGVKPSTNKLRIKLVCLTIQNCDLTNQNGEIMGMRYSKQIPKHGGFMWFHGIW